MPATTPHAPAATAHDGEARRALASLASGSFGAIPADVIAELVVRMTPGADFAVRRAAMAALERRRSFAKRDGLSVNARPERAGVLGHYTTMRADAEQARSSSRVRPYWTLLDGVTPIAGSCDCPDFVRSSLGACKHLLTILEDTFGSQRRLSRARTEEDEGVVRARLGWDPYLGANGPIDRVLGLRLDERGPVIAGAWRSLFVGDRPDARHLVANSERRAFLSSVLQAISSRGRARPQIDATPAARAVVVEELERAERRARCEAIAPFALDHLSSLTRDLYPYQRQGVERFLRAGRLLLADDMGLGKTTQAVAACHALFASKKVRRGLVIAPASLKQQWLREWRDTTKVPVAILDGSAADRRARIAEHRAGFLIVGYEDLLREDASIRLLSAEMVVLDEADRIKNHATRAAIEVKRLTPEYRLVLTGAPMEGRVEELASILDWIDDVALAPKWRLEPLHVVPGGDATDPGAGARNLEALRQRIAPCIVRRTRTEIATQLPTRTDTRVPVEMTPQQREAHDALDAPIAAIAHAGRRRPLDEEEFLRLTRMLVRQRVISNGLGQLHFDELWPAYARARPDAALLTGLFSPKLVELRRLVQDLAVEQRRKIVVCSQWRRMLRLAEWSVRDVLGDAGLRGSFFTGRERDRARAKNLAEFHDDPAVAVLFLSDASGAGQNLQRAASACINLELPWNPAVLEQRVSRLHRIGQKRPIDVFTLVSEHGIEAHVASVAGTRKALFTELFDGASDELRFEESASLLARIRKIVPLPSSESEGSAPPKGRELDPDTDPVDPVADTLDGLRVADDLPPPPITLRSGALEALRAEANADVDVPAARFVELLPGLRAESQPDGGLRLEATPDAARMLLGLLEGLAKLGSAARGTRRDDD